MKKVVSIILCLVFTLGFTSSGMNTKVTNADTKLQVVSHELAPMDREAMVDKLMEDGVIKSGATQDEITQALKNYIGNVAIRKTENKYTKAQASQMEKKLQEALSNATFNGKKLGQNKNGIIDPITKTSLNTPQKNIKVLVVLAEFSDTPHNSIKEPTSLKSSYWTKDFSVDHYRDLLFSENGCTTLEGTYSPSLRSYFREQSNGNLDITGEVYGWVKLSKPAKYYGEDVDGVRGDDKAPREMVIEATELAVENNPGLNLADYDQDGDGVVDHLMVLHSGVGQEQGGGTLGTDAVWSHSWDLLDKTEIGGTGTKIFSYTTEPENGAVGVMAHEFVHDLGIPDDYDTIYSGDGDPCAYWTIMSSGSYCGRPSGTMPSGINPWSRIKLGEYHGGDWINWEEKSLSDLKSSTKLQLDTASLKGNGTQALVIKLPDQLKYVNTPTEGVKEFYGGKGSEIDNSMVLNIDLTNKTTASISYDIWYNTENGWDAGFIQVSEDEGANWTSLSTPYTKTFVNGDGYETIMNSLPGYTGNSNGWLKENINLSSYAGNKIQLRFRYATDWGTELEGMYVDNVVVTTDGQSTIAEGAENGFGTFENHGWTIDAGKSTFEHYYVAEWRSHLGLDEGLAHIWKTEMQYNQGLLLWYRNYAYDNNWMGTHPGYGYLNPVDATQYVYVDNGIGNGNEYGTRAGFIPDVQVHDAAFSLDKAADIDLSAFRGVYYMNPILHGMQAVTTFDDSRSYIDPRSPHSGLILPKYGLKIKVTGKALDYSRGEILISK